MAVPLLLEHLRDCIRSWIVDGYNEVSIVDLDSLNRSSAGRPAVAREPCSATATAVATNVCGSCCVVLGETHMIDRLHIMHPTDGPRYIRRTWRMDALSPPPVRLVF